MSSIGQLVITTVQKTCKNAICCRPQIPTINNQHFTIDNITGFDCCLVRPRGPSSFFVNYQFVLYHCFVYCTKRPEITIFWDNSTKSESELWNQINLPQNYLVLCGPWTRKRLIAFFHVQLRCKNIKPMRCLTSSEDWQALPWIPHEFFDSLVWIVQDNDKF